MYRETNPLCQQFAQILGGGNVQMVNGVCVVFRTRPLHVTIAGRPSRSPATLTQLFTFESVDPQGRALCLGETILMEEELNPFIAKLVEHRINIAHIYSKWLYIHPPLMMILFQSVDHPLHFAQKVRDALSVLRNP